MATEYMWFKERGPFPEYEESWVPASGYAYATLEALEQGIIDYFVPLGHLGPRLSNQTGWELASSYTGEGQAYYWSLTNDFDEDIGTAYKFQKYIPPPTLTEFIQEVILSEIVPSSIAFPLRRPPVSPYI
jgi:hypothetical protein